MKLKSMLVGLFALASAMSANAIIVGVDGEKTVKLDPAGGKVTQKTITVVEGDIYPDLPEATLSNTDFDGWWTAKDGGVQVSAGDTVDLSIFANAKSPTLYAQWHKPHKITVSGGIVSDDKTTSKSGLYRGDRVSVLIDFSKISDKDDNDVNSFANWSYTPAVADLGDDFDPFDLATTVTMPNADVKLTANFVNGFAACLYMDPYQSGEAPEGDFYWSVDNGKTLIPIDRGFPVKAGKVKVKFYDKTGNWRAGDTEITVEKRGTYKKDGVTYYDDPWELYCEVGFVPVNNSTKVKLDANGGTGTREVYFANGCDYVSFPTPYRKGYVFTGWWTAKDGGELVTADMTFDPGDFAGQKTPTLYAHWLQLRKLTIKDESAVVTWYLDAEYFGDDDMFSEVMNALAVWYPDSSDGGDWEGEGVLELLPGANVEVSVSDISADLTFQKWTVSPAKVNLGPNFRVTSPDTEFIMPDSDVTLQAAYIDESNCGRLSAKADASSIYLGYDAEEGDIYIEPPYEAFEWSPDGGSTWYKPGDGSLVYDEGRDSWEEDYGETALLKFGTYNVIWRSNDPNWQAPSGKTKVTVGGCVPCGYGGDATVSGSFTYVPQIVVDVMTVDSSTCEPSSAGGTVAMNPKDGLVPEKKTITLTAKAAKDYAFQGWAFANNWEYGNWFKNTDATWKIENFLVYGMCSAPEPILNQYIDPTDQKVHVVAVFKALSAYDADDIDFRGFEGSETSSEVDDNGEITVKAVVGCALDDDFELICGPLASPLTYKLEGKLPDGLKFDTKTGILSGAPKKVGNSSVTITATDPGKNSKGIKVNFEVIELPSWLVGEFRGSVNNDGYTRQQEGILELSVKSDGKVSAKVITRIGTRSVSGTLSWLPGDEEDPEDEGEFLFWHTDKDDSYCHVHFYSDGTIDGDVDSYDKTEDEYVGGDMEGMYQDTALLEQASFLDKYYTFAFSAETEKDEETMTSGYGYLTIKTDKKGGAKVSGQLPDGEKVSMGALVMPLAFETTEAIGARLYLFASPSSYKKLDWFAMTLTIDSDGVIWSEDGAAWTPADIVGWDSCGDVQNQNAQVTGDGALYSEAASLENYYWTASCSYSKEVRQEYSYKEPYQDDNGKIAYETLYNDAYAYDFDGYLFNVEVKGDKKGAISLDKGPAPWVDDGEWNFVSDKKGDKITNPSQLSISFTKATGIFTGKASVYFDEPKPTIATLPYSGVMICEEVDGVRSYTGLGSAVHSYKYTYWDDNDRAKTDTKKITLPVSLEPLEVLIADGQ